MEGIETIIVGGGQAGLALSYCLKQHNRAHVVFEQGAQAGEVWRNGRWDSFTLVTPNWATRLPGAEYDGDDPDGFWTRGEIVAYFERYVAQNALPVRFGVGVTSVAPGERGYEVETNQGTFEAANVVIATGLYQQPKIPALAARVPPDIVQLHSSQYRNPESLPPGAVLVVGSAQSGCQIAEELYQAGRVVYLSVSSVGRFPRRYRSKDIFSWAAETGFVNRTADMLPSPKARFAALPHVSGKDGGHSLNLHRFARDGVVLLGHVQDVRDGVLVLAPDLKENLARADKFEADFVQGIDAYIAKQGLDAPEERLPQLRDGYEAQEILELDLRTADIHSIVWATGYTFDFSLVKLPVFDADGYPIQQRGVTGYPSLYFLGLPWLHTQKSGILLGVGEDAAYVADHIAKRTGNPDL